MQIVSLDDGKCRDGLLVTCIEGDFFSVRRRSVIFEKRERDECKNGAINMFVNMFRAVIPTLVSLTDLFH